MRERPELPTGKAKARAVRAMFDGISPRYDLLNRLLTFGMDMGWRRRTAEALELPRGSRVLDVACGTGDLCRILGELGHHPIGVDFAGRMLAEAKTDAPLVQADALRLPFPDASIDGVTCGFALRNVTDLDALLSEMARVLRPGGRVGLLEVSEPSNRLLRWGHGIYFRRIVPLVGGILSSRNAYRWLSVSVAYLPDPPEVVRRMRSAGFADVRRRPLSTGIAQVFAGTRT